MAAFFLKKKKEVTETVEEPQKTVEAAKKEAETVNTEPPATIVCPACGREINKKTAEKNKYVCYECGNYFRVRTKNRIRMVADKDTFEPWFEELESKNPLDFPGYPEKIKAAQEKTGLHEAVTVGKCRIYGLETVIGVCDARFMMSSMGHVVGEKIALAVERATELSLPVILFCCSGGARMQEALISAGIRSNAITAHAPAASAVFACSAFVTSMMTPPFNICASSRFNSYCSFVLFILLITNFLLFQTTSLIFCAVFQTVTLYQFLSGS